ncbi:hypothetical protein ACFGVR_02315 [Mucilaginibacter sp. AW1-3]
MANHDYKMSESVDMKSSEAVEYAANETGLSVSHYRACAESAGTYNRLAIEKWIARNYDYQKKQIIRKT